jgi:hypothetical protein
VTDGDRRRSLAGRREREDGGEPIGQEQDRAASGSAISDEAGREHEAQLLDLGAALEEPGARLGARGPRRALGLVDRLDVVTRDLSDAERDVLFRALVEQGLAQAAVALEQR